MTSLIVMFMVVSLRLTDAGDFALVVDHEMKSIFVGSMHDLMADVKPLPLVGLKGPFAVEYDPVEKMVYWSDIKTRPSATISRAHLDGSHQSTVVDGLLFPLGLALDVESRMVYWTDRYLQHVGRAPMSGGNKEILVEDVEPPRAIIVHQDLKKIYWTSDGKNGTIMKSDLDGSNATIIVEGGGLYDPTGIAIDYEDDHLYWIADSVPTKLERSDLSGNNRVLLTDINPTLSPHDMAMYNSFIYWTEQDRPDIVKMYKNGKNGMFFGPKQYKTAAGIHIQKEVYYCDNSTCSNGSTCIDVPNGLRCQCQPGFEGITCSVKSPINVRAWSVPLVFGVLAASLTVCVFIRRQRRELTRVARGGDHDIVENEGSTILPSLLINAVPDVAIFDDIPTDTTEVHAETSLSFPRHLIVITGELGVGNFGRVMLATAIGIEESKKHSIVAVKTLKDEADIHAKGDLLQELDLMRAVGSHPNIVRLLGCCIREDPVYIIMEYLGKGNLKAYLSECQTQDPVYANSAGYSKTKRLSQILVKCARDVASGMSFLSSRKCIHRDLAARNVLISDDMECKVSDFGLSRDITNERIYTRKSKRPLPMRWMALESLVSDVYTTESDVWSFGILLWELVTLGHRPYPLMTVRTMVSKLQNGYRMPRPSSCNEQMYSIMWSCWLANLAGRPTFQSLYDLLDEIFTEEMDYLLLDKLDDIIYDDTVVGETNEIV